MRIVFVYSGCESLGIEFLASFLESRGHQVHLVFDPAVFSGDVFISSKAFSRLFNADSRIVRKVVELSPQVVAFSAYTGNYQWSLRIARAVRELTDAPIVFGGVHPTAVPHRALAHSFIDYVVIGEGEFAFLDVLDHLAECGSKVDLRETPNVCFSHGGSMHLNGPRPYIRDLDSLPFPNKQLFFDAAPLLKHNPYVVMTSRGCPFACAYCSNSMYHRLYSTESRHVRRRSPEHVVEELLIAKRRWDIREVTFLDDVFALSRRWLERFVDLYRSRIGLPFYCHVHPIVVNADVASLLRAGGCRAVGMGVQSGSERIRTEIYNRRGSNARIVEAVAHLKNSDILVQTDNIFGAPTESESESRQSLELCRRLKPHSALSFWLTYYPGTRIVELARANGTLSERKIEEIEEGHVGYTHSTGSVSPDRVPLFARYELLCTLAAFCHNRRIHAVLARVARLMPFKPLFSKCVMTLTSLRLHRRYILNKFRYALSARLVP